MSLLPNEPEPPPPLRLARKQGSQAGGQADGNQTLSIEEIEIDGQTPSSTALPVLGVAQAPPVDYAFLAPAPPTVDPSVPVTSLPSFQVLDPSDQSGRAPANSARLLQAPPGRARSRNHD